MQRFTLPRAAEFNAAENYAENLRQTVIAGHEALVPVGHPTVLAEKAPAHLCPLPDGRLVSVGADHRTVSLDGLEAGKLDADYRAAMADGERIALFTDAGVRLIAGGELQPEADGQIRVGLTLSALSVGLTEAVAVQSPLKGTYPRLSGALQEADRLRIAESVAHTMQTLSARAALRGMLTQQARVGWRILDSDGRLIARGEPQMFGPLFGESQLKFSAVKSDSTFSITGEPIMTAEAFTLNLKVERADSDYWRRRARTLEILVWSDCAEVGSVAGHFSETGSSSATLTVTPAMIPTNGNGPRIAARFDLPLEGLDTRIFFADLGEATDDADGSDDDFIPSAICYGGSLRVYALAGEQGVLAIARAGDPLALKLRTRICDGRILRICPPVGSGGGWNYGRQHFLAFTTAGIFAVSVDSGLKSASASAVSPLTVGRADAVAVATDAIYCATAGGLLLRLRGTRVERLDCPVQPVAALWVETFGELLVIDSAGIATALTPDGLACRRSMRVLRSFVEPAMAVSAAGELLDYGSEQSRPVPVVWRRRVAAAPQRSATAWHSATFTIDSELAAGLKLTVGADSGGGVQRLVELTVNGPVNAPIRARYRAPWRPWLTPGVNGLLMPPSRLVGVELAEAPLPKISHRRRPTQ